MFGEGGSVEAEGKFASGATVDGDGVGEGAFFDGGDPFGGDGVYAAEGSGEAAGDVGAAIGVAAEVDGGDEGFAGLAVGEAKAGEAGAEHLDGGGDVAVDGVAIGVDDAEKGTQNVVLVSEVRESTNGDARSIEADIFREVFVRLGVSLSRTVLVQPGTLAKTSSGKRRHRHFREAYLSGDLEPYYVNHEPGPDETHALSS